MNNSLISQKALREAAEVINNDLENLDDLPVELVNTLANVYYRFFAYKEHISSGSTSLFLNPYVPQSSSMLETYKNNSKFFAETVSMFETATGMVLSARQARAESPELFPFLVTLMLDAFKYNIENAVLKSPIRRAIERKFKKVYEIPDLIEIMRKDIPAEQGDAEAQRRLGLKYARARDDKEAMKWYRLAADQGDAKAQLYLGEMYFHGWGVEENVEQAVFWFSRAAEQGDKEAKRHLATLDSFD